MALSKIRVQLHIAISVFEGAGRTRDRLRLQGSQDILTQRLLSTFAGAMGLSAVAPQFATPTPSTNPMVLNNVQTHGLGAKHNFMEAGNSIHAPPHAIPAISHKSHGSSSNSGKNPLDLLLANPIKFVKTSMMQPAYKTARAEAFGALKNIPKDKKRSTKV